MIAEIIKIPRPLILKRLKAIGINIRIKMDNVSAIINLDFIAFSLPFIIQKKSGKYHSLDAYLSDSSKAVINSAFLIVL
jgi:hypothetical protein